MKGFPPIILLLLTVLMVQVSRGQQSAPLTYTLDAPATGIQTDAALGQSVVMNAQYVVAGAPQDDWAGQNAGVVKVFDAETGALLWVLANPAPDAGDQFGYAIALAGSRLVVGAHLDDTAGLNAGMVYVYDLAGPSPTVPQWVLQHPQPAASDNFGFSVAIAGSLVAVSCHLDDVGATNAGTVLIYDLAGATPTVPTQVVGNPNAALNDQFGYSVALSGTRLAVGTPQDDTGASNDGTVHLFDLAGASPTVPVVSLPNPHPAGQDQFGFTMTMSGNVLVVGVPFDDATTTNAGRVYGYDFGLGYSSTPSWVLDNPAPVSNDQFGYAVALHGQRLVVGVPADDDGGFDTGRAFVYDLGGQTPLVPVASLVKGTRMAEDKLGFAVAIWDEVVAAGVPSDDVGTFNTGSVALFDLASSTPQEMVRLLAHASPSAQDAYGAAVSISGQRIVIGAPRNNSGAPNGGIAYVYDLGAGPPTAPWLTLNHPEPGNGDEMGTTVAISGRWVAVGVSYADRNEIIDSGVVYVFDLTSATPSQPALVVLNPEPQPGDRFGNAVALSGDRLLVGARLDDALAVNSGSAYVYELGGAEPTQPSLILRNPSPAAGDGFGEAVSLSGTLAVIGAAGDNTGATSAGSAYVYDLASATPSLPLVTLNNPAPAANDAFGIAVSIHGQRVVVGAHLDDALATDAGSAYVYDLTSPTPQVAVLTLANPNPASSDQFGLAVAVDGSRVLIGAPLDDQGGQNSGIAYLYEVESETPTSPTLVLTHSPRRPLDAFAGAVALAGERAVVGAAGVDTVAWDKGAAFVFRATLAAEPVDIALEQPVGAELFSGISTIGFGSLVLGANGVDREFTIRNAGLEPLTGVAVQVTGVHAADFVVVEAAPSEVPTGESATFRLRFTPSGGGPRSAVVEVLSNDPDESPFLIGVSGSGIVPLPEIAIEQPADQGLTSGQSLVSFGQVVAQQDMAERVFVVRNSGLADLTGLALEITGLHGAEFTVVTAPATSLVPGGSTTFRLRFTPLGGGERLAMLRVASNDADENPFEIPLQGVGLVIPEIVVEQPVGTALTNGVAVVDFAEARVNQEATDRVLTVRNVGTGDLTGVTVTVAGAQAADWTLVAAPAPVIPVGGSSQLMVRFEPLAGGPRAAQIVITSNDPVQSPFVVGVTGVGKVAPRLVLEQPVGSPLIHGESTVSFEAVKVGGTAGSLTFVLSNAGTAELTGVALSLAGPNAADFAVTSAPASTVAVGGSSSFTVRFAPMMPGESVAVLRVASNDPEHDPFEIELGGTGLAVPIMGLEQPADEPLVLGEAEVDFGQAILGQAPVERAFVLRNLGTGDLNVLSRVISGPDAEAFGFVVQPMSALDPGASSGFVMRFAPTTAGEKRAVVTFLSNDEDRSPFVVELVGTAVALPQLLVETAAGQSLPSGSGEVLFGEAAVAGEPVLVEVVLRNGGTADLTDLGQSVVGAAAADFTLVSALPAVLEPGASASVLLRFEPVAGGARAAQWRLTSNDGVTGDYLVNLSGVGLVSPQIELTDPAGQALVNGAGEVAFGSALVARENTLRTLVMSNEGTGELGMISVTIMGVHADDFRLETAVAGTLAAGAQQAVSLRFVPSGAGVRTATLQVTSDDPTAGTYLVALSGMGLVAPEMMLERPDGTALSAGSAELDFGVVVLDGEQPGLRRVLMRNGGTAELTMVQWTLTGPAAADYQMVTAPPTSVAVGQQVEFELRFDPAAEGLRTAVLVLTSNDAVRSPFEITLTGTGLAVPRLALEQLVGQPLVNGSSLVEFGVAQVRDGWVDRSFLLRNSGSARLELTEFSLTGVGAADYAVVVAPAMELEPGESTSLVVRFAPTVFGDRNATLALLSNDSGASPFVILLNGYGQVVPDLVVEQPLGQPLQSGLSTVISFGEVELGGAGTLRSFQLSNVGTGDLNITEISFSGVNAADFAVVTPPPAVLPAGESAAFLVRFQPTAAGGRSALLRLFSNDPDSSPFEILVSGTGLAVPDIGVEAPVGTGLVSGLGTIDFGPMIMGEALIEREILLRNDGTAVLSNFTIEMVGAQAADFSLDGFRDAPLGVGETFTFRLRFLALAAGTRQATLRISSNDPDESPFEIALVGTGVALPKLRVELANGSAVANGGAGLAFGTVFVNTSPSEQVLRLRNEGAAELTDLVLGLEGANAADFELVGAAISSLSPGASAEWTVRFAPAAGGARVGQLRITSNDQAATPFLVPLQGMGNTPQLAFSTWAANDYQLQGDAALPEAMPQGDGVPNLLKYAFNMAADTPDASILVPGIGTSGLPFTSRTSRRGGSYLRIEFVRRIGSGLIYQPKVSSNLMPGSWTPVTALPLISPVNEQFERVIYEEFYNPSVTMCLFGRVDVTLP